MVEKEDKKTIKDCLEILGHDRKYPNTMLQLKAVLKRYNLLD